MKYGKLFAFAAAITTGIGVIGSAAVSAEIEHSSEVIQVNSAEESSAEATSSEIVKLGYETSSSDEKTELSIKEVAALVMPSMVAITNTSVEEVRNYYSGYGMFGGYGQSQTYETVSAGTGIIVSMEGDSILIATNEHVIDDADSLSVAFIDETAAEAELVGSDTSNDLAVIKVSMSDVSDDTLSQISTITIGSSSDLMVGEQVVAIGNALGYGQSVSQGIVSALNRSLVSQNSQTGLTETTNGMIQTDASINPGNSGGALLNMYGELIGINSAKYSDTSVEGMGYAIPIDTAAPILTEIANGNAPDGSPAASTSGTVELGITGTNVTEEYSDYYGIPTGVYVNSVDYGSSAYYAGISAGDIITAVDGTEVSSLSELNEVLNSYSKGDSAEFYITRIGRSGRFGGSRMVSGTLTVTFSSDDDEPSGSYDGHF